MCNSLERWEGSEVARLFAAVLTSSGCSLMIYMICCFLLFPVFWHVCDIERDTPEKNLKLHMHANFTPPFKDYGLWHHLTPTYNQAVSSFIVGLVWQLQRLLFTLDLRWLQRLPLRQQGALTNLAVSMTLITTVQRLNIWDFLPVSSCGVLYASNTGYRYINWVFHLAQRSWWTTYLHICTVV